MFTHKTIYRLISVSVALVFLFVMGMSSLAQDDTAAEETAVEATEEVVAEEIVAEEVAEIIVAETVQSNLDATWILLAGFLVFFMQAGFAMLEGGFIRHTGVVNSMVENFMDATVTALVFFAVGFGLAYGTTAGGFVGTDTFFLNMADGTGDDGAMFVSWFFQFAFAGAAATIATGAMAERTAFPGKILYTIAVALFIYPIVVHWVWQGEGWLTSIGFLDFAGSTVVHQTGGVLALVGAIMVGPRANRTFGDPPRPHNLMMATLGTFILWFGWYGFNVGSTLAANNVNSLGLVAVNTTLAASAGAIAALFFVYVRTRKYDLSFALNGSLAGLVGITAGCAFVSPIASIIIGITAGIVVVLAVDVVEKARVDDAVGAFAVHGACGALGTLAIGLWGIPVLTGSAGGLFMGGGFDQLIAQATGVVAVTVWVGLTASIIFGAIKTLGLLRIHPDAEAIGIDAAEHGASVWPDILPLPGESSGS